MEEKDYPTLEDAKKAGDDIMADATLIEELEKALVEQLLLETGVGFVQTLVFYQMFALEMV